jgi:hypothetical protein
VLSLEDPTEPQDYKIEGRRLLTDDTEATIRYIYRVTDENQFDAQFIDLFASRLALELATTMVDSQTLKAELLNEYKMLSTLTKGSDAIEGTPTQPQESSWVRARR